MKQRKVYLILIIASIIAGLIFGGKLFENDKDPVWFYVDSLMVSNGIIPDSTTKAAKSYNNDSLKIIPLEECRDTLEKMYLNFHKDTTNLMPLWQMISEPFLPSIEFKKFTHTIDFILTNKKVVISGVTGAGKTTLIKAVSKYITGTKKSRTLKLECVEDMGVQYHNYWIGNHIQGRFYKGRLLEFIETAKSDPENNYIFIIDDIDKIHPGTFFGAEFWAELNEPRDSNAIEGYGEIYLPNNFFLISVTHEGVGSTVELNNEHFRRLGNIIYIFPEHRELLLNLKSKVKKLNLQYNQVKKLHYSFIKINELIENNYGKSYTLGQWATLTKFFKPEDFTEFQNVFIEHVNAFKVKNELKQENLNNINYSINNDGSIPNTFFLAKIFKQLIELGIFSELTVAIAFALVSAIFGWIYFLNKKKYIRKLHNNIQTAVNGYKERKITYDDAYQIVIGTKQVLEEEVLKDKVKYEIANFLFFFINDQLKILDEVKKLEDSSAGFMDTFEKYFEDGVITDSEFKSLSILLEGLKEQVDKEIYFRLKNYINDAYEKGKRE